MSLSTIDFAIFCLTSIALVAIVYRKDEIAAKAISVIGKTTDMLGNNLKKSGKS